MSKFAKPGTKPKLTAAEIDRVIGAAEAHDASPPAAPLAEDVRFTMTLPGDLADAVDAARKRARLTRLAWIRLAVAEKLEREGR
jgi:hypothetical protein